MEINVYVMEKLMLEQQKELQERSNHAWKWVAEPLVVMKSTWKKKKTSNSLYQTRTKCCTCSC